MSSEGFVIEGEMATRSAQHVAQISALALHAQGIHARPGFIGRMAEKVGSSHRVSKAVLEDAVVWGYRNGIELGAVWNTVERGLGEARTAKLRWKCDKIIREKAEKIAKEFK